MYCQSCGAQNPDDARFCNMCGSRIAGPGAPGGPLADGTVQGVGGSGAQQALAPGGAQPPAGAQLPAGAQPPSSAVQTHPPTERLPADAPQGAPSQPGGSGNVWAQHEGQGPQAGSLPHPMGYAPQAGGPSMSSVSLHAIGVQSSRKTWAVLIATGVMLVALGAVGAYLLMGSSTSSDEAVAEGGRGSDMEIGTPLPEGMEAPDVDFVSGGVRVSEEGNESAGGGSGSSGSSGSGSSGSGSSGGGSGASGSGSSGGSGGSGSSGTSHGGSGSSGGSGSGTSHGGSGSSGSSGGSSSGGSGSSSSGSSSGGGTGSSGTGSSGSSGSGSGSSSGGGGAETGSGGGGAGTIPEGELPEERDIALEMYASRVRFVIRRYYAARAQTCFDRATRNNPGLRGTVVVRFTIGEDGAVSDSRAIRNSTGYENLGVCLANQVGSWRLPAPPGGELTLEMPFSN